MSWKTRKWGVARKVAGFFLVGWFVLTLPVVGVLAFSEYSRFIMMQTCSHWRAKVFGSNSVFIGDSLTAGGRNWGLRLGTGPFSGRNLGVSGCTVHQVAAQASEAIKYHPARVFVLAGTNDILEGREIAASIRDYDTMLKLLVEAPNAPTVVVTLVPQTAIKANSAAIKEFNKRLLELCQRQGVKVVDLNQQIAPDGVLLPQFSVDGVHLTEAAYGIWSQALRATLVPSGRS